MLDQDAQVAPLHSWPSPRMALVPPPSLPKASLPPPWYLKSANQPAPRCGSMFCWCLENPSNVYSLQQLSPTPASFPPACYWLIPIITKACSLCLHKEIMKFPSDCSLPSATDHRKNSRNSLCVQAPHKRYLLSGFLFVKPEGLPFCQINRCFQF